MDIGRSVLKRMMTRDRFMVIFWLLHVSRERDDAPARRIDKVKDLLDILIPIFQASSSYQPSQNISVDETMVGFRGHFGAKQYIPVQLLPLKPQKYGIKAFTMADSDGGYMLDILVYTGADTLINSDSRYSSYPQPARVVLHLLQPYLDKGHHVYTDRYYTSIPLAEALMHRSTAFTGTAMRNRKNLPEVIRKSLRLGENQIKAFRSGRLMAIEWRAMKKNSLVMLSTQCSAGMTSVRVRRNQEEVQKPIVVNEYNYSMNGVDRANQNSVYYPFIRKTRSKLFFWVIEVAVVNSFILYQIHCTELNIRPLTQLQYRRSVVESLAARYLSVTPPRARPGRPRKR